MASRYRRVTEVTGTETFRGMPKAYRSKLWRGGRRRRRRRRRRDDDDDDDDDDDVTTTYDDDDDSVTEVTAPALSK